VEESADRVPADVSTMTQFAQRRSSPVDNRQAVENYSPIRGKQRFSD
jgi:hypothetical protein